MSVDDDLAKLRAEVDQARESMKELAGPLWGFYTALQEEGFTASEALTITISWLTAVSRGGTSA